MKRHPLQTKSQQTKGRIRTAYLTVRGEVGQKLAEMEGAKEVANGTLNVMADEGGARMHTRLKSGLTMFLVQLLVKNIIGFLDASTHLCMRISPSVIRPWSLFLTRKWSENGCNSQVMDWKLFRDY